MHIFKYEITPIQVILNVFFILDMIMLLLFLWNNTSRWIPNFLGIVI